MTKFSYKNGCSLKLKLQPYSISLMMRYEISRLYALNSKSDQQPEKRRKTLRVDWGRTGQSPFNN